MWKKVLDDCTSLEDNAAFSYQLMHKGEEIQLCVTKSKGVMGVLNDICPHKGASLSKGFMKDGFIECPLHRWNFHPQTGCFFQGGEGVKAYKVKVEDHQLYVQLAD